MESQIILSIDGRAGAELVQDPESHLHVPRPTRDQLQPGSNGRDGIDAPPALPGEPAGAVAVEISPSQSREGGITVKVLGGQRATRSPLPPVTEIPPHTKVHLSARGGKGEPGRKGGAGAPGAPGQDGNNATRATDATDGGPGGVGGAGGRGSDGGRGGPGGKILIYVDENQTELLHAVTWDVSGGKGGEAGPHGQGGEGGAGGKGGGAVVWEDISHYKYNCTQYCIGGTSDVATLPHGGDATLEMIRRLAAGSSRSSLLSNALVSAVGTAHRLQRPTIDGGACRCKGGPDHCAACEKKPIFRTFAKSGGRDGAPGVRGPDRPREDTTFEGEPGAAGSVDIVVRHKNGDRPKYNSKFDLALVGFDVEDGNGDGIFEPGEDIFVRQVRIQNKGGMPSPSTPIFCEALSSDLVRGSQGVGDRAHLPTSIPAGNADYTSQSIRCYLDMFVTNVRSLPPYSSQQTISLRGILPWLREPLAQFDVSKSITVQFPLELRDIKVPGALTPRFAYSVRWEILNKSHLLFGNVPGGPGGRRVAKVLIMIDSKQGELLDREGNWVSSTELIVPDIAAQSRLEMSQRVRVKDSAIPHEDLTLSWQLFISTPKQEHIAENPPITSLHLIESHKARIQVAPGHTPANDDDVLVVTNPDIKKTQLEAVVQWLEGELQLKVNVWNVGIYGGLLTEDPGEEGMLNSVLPSYAGKFVIFLGTQFVATENRAMSVLKICDSESIQDACEERTSCLFFGANKDPTGRSAFERLLRPIFDDPVAIADSLPETFRFQKQDDLIRCLQRSGGDGSKYYLVKVSKSIRRKGMSNMTHAAKILVASLREKVPHSHFVVCMLPADYQYQKDREDGNLLVWQGLSRLARLEATTSDLFDVTDGQSSETTTTGIGGLRRGLTLNRRRATTLSSFDRFCILGSMPSTWKLQLLNDLGSHPLPAETIKLIVLSICSQIDHEIQTFLAETEWPNSIDVREQRSLEEYLPSVYALVSGLLVAQNPSPQLLSVVSYCQASSRPQNSKQSISQKVVPFGHRRRQLFKYIASAMMEKHQDRTPSGKLKKHHSPTDSQIFGDLGTSEPFLTPPDGRCISSSLVKMVGEATGKSQHYQERARYGVCHALERNDILDAAEWRQLAQRSKDQREEVLQLFHYFQEEQERYGMTTDGSTMAG